MIGFRKLLQERIEKANPRRNLTAEEPDHLTQQQKPKTCWIYSLELSKMRGQANR